jgi:CRP-like cAMP-binding protein
MNEELSCTNFTSLAPCFRHLSKKELKEITAAANSIHYNKGETIRKQGTFVASILFVKSGIAKIYSEFEHAESKSIVDFRKKGQLIGLTDIFNSSIVKYSISALTDCEVCSIDIHLFEKFLNANGSFAVDIIEAINLQSGNIVEYHIQNNFKQLHGRMAHALLILSKNVFESHRFDFPLTRRDFAEFTNMSSMSVVRILKAFKNDKLIEMNEGLIRLLDIEKLEKLSQVG